MSATPVSPANGAANVAADAAVTFQVTGTALADITVEVDEGSGFVLAYASSAFAGVFSGSVATSAGPTHDFTLAHPDWSPGATVTVRVTEGGGVTFLRLNAGSPADSVIVADHADLSPAALSFGGWVRLDDPAAAYTIASKFAPNQGWALSLGGGQLSFAINVFLGAPSISSVPGFAANTWHHVFCTYDAAGNAALYVDGVAIVSGALGATYVPTTADLVLGSPGFGATTLDLHRMSFYDAELSAVDVAALHAAGLGADPTGLVGAADLLFVLDAASSTAPNVADLNAGGGAATVAHPGAFGHGGMSASNFVSSSTVTSWAFTVAAALIDVRLAQAAFAGGGMGLDASGALVSGDAEAPAAPAGTPVVSSWCQLGRSWLLSQFSGQPRIEAILCAALDRVQDVEQALADLRDLSGLDTAFGALLDRLGVAQGLPRDELPDPRMSDDAYRQALRAKRAADASGGSVPDVLRCLLVALSGSDVPRYTPDHPAGYIVDLGNPHLFAEGRLAAQLGRRAKPAGVRYHLRYRLRDTGLPTQTLAEVGGPVTQAMSEVGSSPLAVMAEADEGR